MNKSDKYYLKEGRLELSMLDEEEYGEKGLFNNLEFEHTRRLRDVCKKNQQKPQQALKVSNDIYNTLHTMGQFLTKMEPQPVSAPIKKSMNLAKSQKLEQIASSIRVQELELSTQISKQKHFNSLSISEVDQIKEINKAVNIGSVERNQVDIEFIQIEGQRPFIKSDEVTKRESNTLDQNHIDDILTSFFKIKETQYTCSKDLKRHIDKHIMEIKNYE